MSLIPVPIALPAFAADDPRLGTLLGASLAPAEPPRVSIVGFAVDQGVERNGGRTGAREGPRALRDKLYRMCPDPRAFAAWVELLGKTRDLGDVVASGDLERDQELLAEVVARALGEGSFVIVLGGGHETSYGHFLGYARLGLPVAVQNLDAHADVRPLKAGLGHSGSPFRQMLEHPSGLCSRYSVAGLQPNAVASAHVSYLAERGARAQFRREFAAEELFADQTGTVLATFCLDCVDQAFAPGVSAPTSDGLSVTEWLEAAARAGACAAVRSFDVVELNPSYDRDGQTTRLAARTVWEVLRGLLTRRA